MDASAGPLFAFGSRQQLEQSFKDFATRPENKPLLEQHQKEEVAAALQLQEQAQQAALEQQISRLDTVDRKLLGPVLRSAVLCQLLVSLSNDYNNSTRSTSPTTSAGVMKKATAAAQPLVAAATAAAVVSNSSSSSGSSGLQAWLSNPRVMQLLREAAKALKQGRITEEQLAAVLQQQVQVMQQGQAAVVAEPAPAPHQVMLPSHVLVEALNEHLTERQAGNKAYKQQQYQLALHHYQRALAVVNFVVGSNADDHAEVQYNKAAVMLNIAAVHMAQEEWGAAVGCCDDVLAIAQQLGSDVPVKAWLRRCKANLGRHEYQAALQDLSRVEEVEPWHEDIPLLRGSVLQAQRAAQQTTDKQLAAKMFKKAL